MGTPADKPASTAGQKDDLQALLAAASSAIFRIQPRPITDRFEFYSITSHPLAKLWIYLSESDPFTVHRRQRDILDDSSFDFLVLVQLEGSAEIEQRGAAFSVYPDSLAIIPGGMPYRLSFLESGKRLLLRIPLTVFHERILGRQIRDFGAQVYKGAGLVQITTDLLKSLVMQAGALSETEQHTVAEVTLDLVTAVVHTQTDFGHIRHGSAQVARMSRILSYLEEHFAEHGLSPAKVAEANSVSTRHLHNLFQHSGTTVTRWIWERRLKAAREDLLNPCLADRSITEISYNRGFSDSAHFSRTFKSRFGVAPSELRRQALEGAQT